MECFSVGEDYMQELVGTVNKAAEERLGCISVPYPRDRDLRRSSTILLSRGVPHCGSLSVSLRGTVDRPFMVLCTMNRLDFLRYL